MKIAESQVKLESARAYRHSHTREERLQVQWGNRSAPSVETATPIVALQVDRFDLSTAAQLELQQRTMTHAAELGTVEDKNEQQARLIETLLSALLGKEVRIRRLDTAALAKAREQAVANPPAISQVAERAAGTPRFAMSYDYREVKVEQERLELGFSGTVVTAEGETIDFALRLQMERSSYEERSLSLRIGQMVDPLVINFAAPTATLGGQRFNFDLTADGRDEQVPLLAPGSGFLVLDRNGDGQVNDGRELFGTESGNGFADLAQLDADGNNWIDAGDAVFDQLRVWVKEQDQEKLVSLSELGIGALYLGSVTAQFSLQGENGQALGQQQRAGLFLRQNKTVGTMQHIDVLV